MQKSPCFCIICPCTRAFQALRGPLDLVGFPAQHRPLHPTIFLRRQPFLVEYRRSLMSVARHLCAVLILSTCLFWHVSAAAPQSAADQPYSLFGAQAAVMDRGGIHTRVVGHKAVYLNQDRTEIVGEALASPKRRPRSCRRPHDGDDHHTKDGVVRTMGSIERLLADERLF